MTLKLYTLRGKHSGRLYYGTGHTKNQAAKEIGISPRDLILERSEVMPPEGTQLVQDPFITRHTVQYRGLRK